MTIAMEQKVDKQTMMQDWFEMAEKIKQDSLEQEDEMISYLASMLSAEISEHLRKTEKTA